MKQAMELSLWTGFFHDLAPADALRELAAAGFSRAEISAEHFTRLTADDDPARRIADFRRCAADFGVTPGQLHAPICSLYAPAGAPEAERIVDLVHPDPAVRERETRVVERWLDWGGAAGVACLVVHPGHGVADDSPAGRCRRQGALEVFGRLADKAARAGVQLALENNGRALDGRALYGARPGDLRELLDGIDSRFLGMCLDTSHANLFRAEFSPVAFVATAGDRLIATHLSDNTGRLDEHLFPWSGRGNGVDWQAFMLALRAAGYRGLLNLEVPGENRCPLEIRRLKAVHARRLLETLRDLPD